MNGATALTGDAKCSRAMCVKAFVNSTGIVTYKLTVSQSKVGWMAVGFGTSMIDSPIVMLYTNSTGQTVLSHLIATAYIMPVVNPNPQRTAKAYDALESVQPDSSTLAFTIPANSDTTQDIIWGYSKFTPTEIGNFPEHDDRGTMSLNLLKSLDSSASPSSPHPGSADSSDSSAPSQRLTYNQSLIAAHGIIMSMVFFFLLPIGSLLARLGRTFWPKWFLAHSSIQGWICGPLVLVAFVLAVTEVGRRGGNHLNTRHKKVGIGLCVLYVVQASLGTIIHFFKPKSGPSNWHPARRRTPQNYLHAIMGLTILGLGFYEVRTGYKDEWPSTQDMAPVSDGVERFWIAWVVILSGAYIGGLILLRKQWAQERSFVQQATTASKFKEDISETSS